MTAQCKIAPILSLVAAAFLTLGACDSAPDSLPRPEPGGDADVEFDVGGGDAADTGDADASSDPIDFDESLWREPNPCEGEVSFPDDDSEFEIPDRAEPEDTAFGRSWFIERYGALPLQAFGVYPAANLEPGGDGRAHQLFTEPGTDVRFHVYFVNDYEGEELASFRINLTAMVDYEPVEAEYVRWSPEREEELSRVTATGVNVQADSDVEIFDVTIPAEAFDEERMYDVGLNLQSNTILRSPSGDVRRYALFNGGYDRPNRPCAEPRLDDELTEFEVDARGRISDDIGVLFFEGITSRDELRELIEVEPGETIRLYLSVYRTAVKFGAKPTVLQPVLNGEPFGETWWVEQGSDVDEPRRQQIDARKSFEVTLPEEPGTYEVQVLSWEDPFEIARDLDNEPIGDISDGGSSRVNSNALRFRVRESE